jgi:hypothetical protein
MEGIGVMAEGIEILVGDVTDVEARVIARWGAGLNTPPAELGSLSEMVGTVRGPYCDRVKTLVAEFGFRVVEAGEAGVVMAEAVVTDPCMWSEEMPHLYDVDVEARRGESVVAEYHGKIGLRRLAPRRVVDFAPGTG